MKTKGLVLTTALLLACSVAALAHHSFDAEYDRTKPISLKGKVAKMEWMNPHIWIYMDVTDEKGATQRWQVEGGAPNSLRRNGWNRDSVKEGETLSIEGSLAKDGSKTVNARSVMNAAGKRMFAGSSDGEAKGGAKE